MHTLASPIELISAPYASNIIDTELPILEVRYLLPISEDINGYVYQHLDLDGSIQSVTTLPDDAETGKKNY